MKTEKNNVDAEKDELKENCQEETQDQAQKQDAGKEESSSAAPQPDWQKEAADYKDKYIRLYAEFENTRKRLERDKQEFVKYAQEGIIVEFLSILDTLELSVKGAKSTQDQNAFLKGIEMVIKQIHDLLLRNGVKPIKAVGRKFDPHYHEILMQEETDKHEEGIVLEEYQRGYMLNDRVIRTVKVKIAKKIEK